MKITESEQLFLDVLSSALKNEKMTFYTTSSEIWMEVFHLAKVHHVLPLLVHVIQDSLNDLQPYMTSLKQNVRHQFLTQSIHTQVLLDLLDKFEKKGIKVLVIKGLICRNLYPEPNLRPSSDEDLLVSSHDFIACCHFLLELGATSDCTCFDDVQECSFVTKQGLKIELHRQLFNNDAAYSFFNDEFEGCFNRSECYMIEACKVWTMNPTDHFWYLFMHAVKHFLHGGFGVRQVCDLMMFEKAYGSYIDWELIYKRSLNTKTRCFLSCLMRIANDVLKGDHHWHPLFEKKENDPEFEDLLKDMLQSGVYGTSTMNRRHTSELVLHEYAKDQHRNFCSHRVLFLPLSKMKGKYTYLNHAPYLLPIAWIHRGVKYGFEMMTHKDSHLKETLDLAEKRKELLYQYKMIDKK